MLRRQDSGWVDEAWKYPDPDEVEDSLEILSIYTGTLADAFWHHMIEIDPEEMDQDRRKQIVQMTRYGRLNFDWEEMEIPELRRWYRALKDTLDDEDALSRANENK